MIINLSTTYFILVVFNEQWLVSTLFYVPCVTLFYLNLNSASYEKEDTFEAIVKIAYSILVYAVIAYITEIRAKQTFLGRDQSDKAFNRWLKIFETFPEGIALIRSNYVLYANKSLHNILEIQ